VSITPSSAPALAKTAAAIIADAKRFLGLPYLWDGSSAFGFDCSGITYAVYRTHGILLPRDSFMQATTGRAVSRSELKAGDLVFFAANGKVHHVGIYLGNDQILDAPRTGMSVEIVSLTKHVYASEFAGGRRYL
jgi:cell wall-associated NlpC family hydrolase